MRIFFPKAVAVLVMGVLIVAMTGEWISASFAEAKEPKSSETVLVDRFITVLGGLVETSDADSPPELPDARHLLEITALENAFDQSVLTSRDLYDPSGMPSPPPPGTMMRPIEIRTAIDNGDIRVDVAGTGDRSSIKLTIHNLKSDEWVLVGIPFGIQFKANSAQVQNMGIR